MRSRLPFLLIGLFLMLTVVAICYREAPVFFGSSVSHATSDADFSFLFMAGFLVFIIACFFLWLAALIHMLKNPAIQGTDKIVWALVIIFLQVLGAILYFLLAPRSKIRITLPGKNF